MKFLFSVCFVALAAQLAPAVAQIAHASDLAYFQQFIYKEREDADGNVSTRFLMGHDIEVGKRGNDKVLAMIDIVLFQDGNFVINYSEVTDHFFPVSMENRFTGKWSVPGNELVLGDVATGTRAVWNGQNAVLFKFTKDLVTPGLKGRSSAVPFGFSNRRYTEN